VKQAESKLQREIRKHLKENYGGFWFKTHGSMFQMTGLPDIIGCLNGLFIGIEVKWPGKDLQPQQRTVSRMIKRAGGICFRAFSVDSADRKLRRELVNKYEAIKNQTLQLPEKGCKKGSRKKILRVICGDRDRQDSHDLVNPNKVTPKRRY
jgi:hypothetical protein